MPDSVRALPVITEFLANTTSTSLADEDGDTEDWIEITNTGSSAIDLSGYRLVDAREGAVPWVFPNPTPLAAGDLIIVFASDKDRATSGSQLHTDFKLGAGGDSVTLQDPGGNAISSFLWDGDPGQFPGISFGIFGAQAVERYFETPSPGAPNGDAFFAPGSVQFSESSKAFTGQLTIQLATDIPGAQIRYTTDRKEPDPSSATDTSTLYTEPFVVSSTTMVRARVIDQALGGLGELSGRHYIKLSEDSNLPASAGSDTLAEFTSNLPVIILDTFGGSRFRDTRAQPAVAFVYEPGPDGRTSLTGDPSYSVRVTSRIRGQSSSGFPKKQYRIEVQNQEGEDRAIPLLGLPEESDWVFSAPYTDKALIRNSTVFALGREIGLLAPRTRHFEIFINESSSDLDYSSHYKGVYLLAESIKRDRARVDIARLLPEVDTEPDISGGYIMAWEQNVTSSNERIPRYGNLKLVEPDPADASSAQEQWLSDYIWDANLAVTADDFTHPTSGVHYDRFIDVPSYLDFFVINELTRDQDGYIRSSYFHKDRNGPLVMGPLWDYNLTWGTGCCRNNTNAAPGRGDSGWQYIENTASASELKWERFLMDDPDFKQAFTDRWQQLRKTVLSDAGLAARIDAQAEPLGEAAIRNFDEWDILDEVKPGGTFFSSPVSDTWEEQIDQLKEWTGMRMAWIDSEFVGPAAVSRAGNDVTFTGPSGTTVHYTTDGTDPRLPGGSISGAAATASFTLTENTAVTARARNSSGDWSSPTYAILGINSSPAAVGNIVVSEIHYRPAGPGGAEVAAGFTARGHFEFIEVQNVSPGRVDLSLAKFTDGVSYTFPAGSVLEPSERIVLAADRMAFASRNPGVTPAGELDPDKRLSDSGDRIRLATPNGETILDFRYNDKFPWPETPDGEGPSLVLISPGWFPDLSVAQNWRPSTASGGNPGGSDTVPFSGIRTEDTDGDGLTAFMEYALGTSDAVPNSAVLSITPRGDGSILLGHPRNLLSREVSFVFSGSDDLSGWQVLDPQPLPDPDAGSAEPRYIFGPGTDLKHMFLRLEAEGD